MIKKCDICGFNLEPDAHFCSGCNVELKVPEEADNVKINPEKPQPGKKKTTASPKQEAPENEEVINWCVIHAWCNTYKMSFPLFFNLVSILARGEKKLGFCNCSTCNLGYREMIANVTRLTENRKVTAQSREIVMKARGIKIEGMTFDFSEFLTLIKENEGDNHAHEKEAPKPQQTNNGKIVIEIDPGVLENAIFAVLKNERGQEAIRSVPRKNAKTKAEVR
jgi:hypothetical protein